uniref:NACHT domain-containing protein n=1 Tax=Mola mola TaxID=94237 RepID=A0A3Q3XET1_MOLML
HQSKMSDDVLFKRDTVLSNILSRKGLSSFLGGEQSDSLINSSKYISPLISVAEGTDGNLEGNLPSLHNAIYNALSDDVTNVVLVGSEGSGKTIALEKLVVDWAKGECLKNFSCVFHFRMRELNCLDGALSLHALLRHYHGHISAESMALVLQKPEDVLFVLDDVHQCNESLDPSVHTLCSDPSQLASPSCLVASLLHRSLMKGAAFVVATRPTGIMKFLSGTQVEVLGFLKPQREAYFSKFFTNPAAANKALMHMERTLGCYDICTSPRFCWTVCSIYKCLMDAGKKLPETLFQLYVNILVYLIQTLSLNEAYNRELVLALGKMASHCFLDQHLSCTTEEMDSFGLRQFLGSVGVFLQVDGDHSDRCNFSFPSQQMQEFLLATSFFLENSKSEGVEKMLEKHNSRAKFLDSFMSALSEPVQRRPLETLLGEMNSDRVVDFKHWFKSSSEMILKGYCKDKHLHCFHLLYQAQNESLVKELITSSDNIGMSYGDLSLQDCVALNYVVKCLGEMKMLNLYRTRNLTEGQAELLAPTISMSHKIILLHSSLSTGAVTYLASALSRGITKELDLTQSCLGDDKFKILCVGLRDCKLQHLKLEVCSLTEASCEDLASVLTSGTSQLRVLYMRCNQIRDQGFMKMCKALCSPLCKLQELHLQYCELTSGSMEALSAALISGQSELKKVNLAYNNVGLRGVEAFCKSLHHPLCTLRSVIFYGCELTGECCHHFMEALMSENCLLAELDLSVNNLGQEGGLLLCQALSRPGCRMETLCLQGCELTQSVFQELGSVLRSGTSQLRSLSVGVNTVGDQGVKHLWDAVAHPGCLLEELDVEMTGLTDASLEDLCTAVRASKTLKSVELSNNSLTDDSVRALVQVTQQSQSMLEMRYAWFTSVNYKLSLASVNMLN